MPKAIGIYRETKLAGKPGPDQRILDLTAEELRKRGFDVLTKKPEEFSGKEKVDLIFTMARGEKINELLMKKEKEGIFVINSPKAIRFSLTQRAKVYQKMKKARANIPETKVMKIDKIKFSDLKEKSILKPATRHEFWFIVESATEFKKAIKEYKKEKITEIIVQKFIEGKHIKYYAIGEEVILPKDIDKEISLKTMKEIKKQALIARKVTGLQIFGGDFMIKDDIPYFVDANDWPSMASIEGFTQQKAAKKIADLIERKYNVYRKSQKNI
jgi:glutathione synthase/RimK-type ligase-like ATP-grasp enzyme